LHRLAPRGAEEGDLEPARCERRDPGGELGKRTAEEDAARKGHSPNLRGHLLDDARMAVSETAGGEIDQLAVVGGAQGGPARRNDHAGPAAEERRRDGRSEVAPIGSRDPVARLIDNAHVNLAPYRTRSSARGAAGTRWTPPPANRRCRRGRPH